jgi:acetyl-CoA acetyltransferase
MGERKEMHTFCGVCHLSCAVVATVQDGARISVRPDKGSKSRHEVFPAAKGPLTLMGVENHPDCLKYPLNLVFRNRNSITFEIYEQLGLCPLGDAGKLIEEGVTEMGGKYPVNVSGAWSARESR